MNGHLMGARSEREREAWLQRRSDWQRNNPTPATDPEDDQ